MTIQEVVNVPDQQEKVRGTVKGAVLTGDDELQNLVAVSVYDTKPVNFLSMCCETVQWIPKKRNIFDKVTMTTQEKTFLRLNINDFYNKEMGDVDIADQVRGSYRIDKWMRKYKWWHAIFWWGFQVMMTNSYICYKTFMIQQNLKPMSHYDFQKSIAKALISGIVEKTNMYLCDNSTTSSLTSNNASSSASDSKKRINDCSLHPITGSLRCRLDHVSAKHWPTVCKRKQDYCQLHRWAMSRGSEFKYGSTVHCSECNVTLCTGYCYQIFHELWDVVSERQNIQNRMLRDDIDV